MVSNVINVMPSRDTRVDKNSRHTFMILGKLLEDLKEEIGSIYEDVTTDVLGSIGPWQWLIVFICTTYMLPPIFNQYEDMFLLRPMNGVFCIPPDNFASANTSLCYIHFNNNTTSEIKCEKWHVKLLSMIWLKKSWLVFCDEKMKLISTTMICRMGQMFGCIIFGLIADSFGRKKAIMIDVLADLSLSISLTFCDAEGWYRLLVFVKSLLHSANFYMGLVLICEIASNGWRSCLNTIVMLPRLLSFLCVVPLANSSPNLETYSFSAAIFGILFMVLLRWTPESPQWLLFNRKISKAEKLLYNSATKNGINLCSDFKIRPINHRAYNCIEETMTCLGILTTNNIRIIVLVSTIFWSLYYFQWSCLYVRLYSKENTDQLLLKTFCFIGVLGCLTILLAKKLLLRHLLLINILLTGVFATASVCLHSRTIHHLLSLIALASNVIGHALLLNVTPRFFATKIRATLFGVCHAMGQLGSVIAYLIFLFQPLDNEAMIGVGVGVTVILAALSFVFLDVDGRELPDVVEDMDYFSELSKPLRWVTQKTNSPSSEEVEMRVYSFGSSKRDISQVHSEERLPSAPIANMLHPIIDYCYKIVGVTFDDYVNK